jgi:DNA-binding transcriptional regulator YiaG
LKEGTLPNFASLIRQEVRRLARKESNAAVAPLRKHVAGLRRRVAEQRQKISELERAARTAAAAAAMSGRAPGAAAAEGSAAPIRFSPAWMRKHRAKLGMSRETYAKLLGVSAQSVLVWETGRARPRQKTVETWARLRQMRVRDIKDGLVPSAGAEVAPAKRTRRRRKPARRTKTARRVRAARRPARRAVRRKAKSRRSAARRRR